MNKELFSKYFHQLKPYIADRWNKLTNEDLDHIDGHLDRFLSKIEEKYHVSKEEIEEQINRWTPNVRFEDENSEIYKSKKESESEEGASIGKWLVLAGLPFLFLLGYLGTHFSTTDKTLPNFTTSSNQMLYTKQPQEVNLDNALSENVRKVLLSNSLLLNDLKNLKIETKAGAVTISGSVKTAEEKALVDQLIEKIPGIIKVDNKIEVVN